MGFFSLFRSAEPDDGLAQTEREAIADLLHLCMYADNHLASAEDTVVDEAVAAMSWDPSVAFESYEAGSIARAREAVATPETREFFFRSLRQRLTSNEARNRALTLCDKLFFADGKTTQSESALHKEIKQLLA